jgi:hypothetical protein
VGTSMIVIILSEMPTRREDKNYIYLTNDHSSKILEMNMTIGCPRLISNNFNLKNILFA